MGLYIINQDSMSQCVQSGNDDDLFEALETTIFGLNNINICLWTMGAMSLSAGLVIDIICSSIREWEYCIREDLDERDSCWNKMTVSITRIVAKLDLKTEEALEDVGLK